MKTIFDELQQEVKNWWISLILGILYVIVAISLMFSPLERVCGIEHSVQRLHVVQRSAGNILCSK